MISEKEILPEIKDVFIQGHWKTSGLGYVHYVDCGNSFMVNQTKLLNITLLICTLYVNYILINLLPMTNKEIDGGSSML